MLLVFQPDGVVRPGAVVVHVDDTSIGYSIYSSKLSVVTVEQYDINYQLLLWNRTISRGVSCSNNMSTIIQ